MKKYIAAFFLSCCLQAQAQEATPNLFISPFDFPLYLSANFGELRSNHFHGGIDFKTQNVEGKPIRCIADGYISRATVSPGGFGNALYVVHTNGFTSVYGHLKSFSPEVAKAIEKYQYEHETFSVDLSFDSLRLPVKQGDIIALSGNSGYSFGPHLHMEIHKTSTGERVNPLTFYKNKIKDRIAPQAKAIMFYPQKGKGIINGISGKQLCAIGANKNTHCLPKPIDAWGEIGTGIKAFDYMDGTTNNYGIYSVTLYVDSAEVFNSTINAFMPNENRTINSLTDFNEFRSRDSWIMKSFIAPGNNFQKLRANKKRGIVTINQERDYHFTYILKDLYGNQSAYHFIVKGKKQFIPEYHPNTKHYLKWDKTNIIQEPGMELVIPKGMVYEDVALNCFIQGDTNDISYKYCLHNEEIPLHAGCELMIGLRNMPVKDTSKYYIARKAGKANYYIGGKLNDGWIKTPVRELGTYSVAIDTIPPKVVPINKAGWKNSGTITYRISDGQTGIDNYKGKIDGKFALFAFDAKTARLTCQLDARHIRKGGQHVLELTVTDCCGNTQIVKELFMW